LPLYGDIFEVLNLRNIREGVWQCQLRTQWNLFVEVPTLQNTDVTQSIFPNTYCQLMLYTKAAGDAANQ
jgi:hypothetical protein